MKTRIYVAGPYTQGDVGMNVGTAMEIASRLVYHGFAPFIPHLFHFVHMLHPRSYRTWMEVVLVWLPVCDALLRLPGVSPGADDEVMLALSLDIPVFYSLADLLEALK